MKYVQPYGISDPDAPYINGDPSIARQGSIPPAAAFEHPMRELVHIITDSGIAPDSADLEQCAKGIRSQRMNYCEDTGSVNNLSVALDPPLGAYTFGLPLHVKVRNTCTGPSTIDAGAGRVPIRKPNGAETAAGDLNAFGMAALVYDGTVFQMINFGGAGGAGPGDVFMYNIPYCVDSSATRNQVTANFSPAITSAQLVAGFICMVKIANTNNGVTGTMNVNGLGNKPIFAQGCNVNWPLLPGDIQVGDVLVFTFDGTRFWVYANTTITENVTLNVSTVAQTNDLFAALGRKRISTSGSLRILMAVGIYQSTGGGAIITTYHADADRIILEGTMLPGQVPPSSGAVFQRSGSTPAARANDAAFNIQMLRARYGTEFRIGATGAGIGLSHVGPGMITYRNILVTGPNYYIIGQGGFQAIGNMKCDGCSVWGMGDIGYGSYQTATLIAINSHACACASRGFAATGSSAMEMWGGSSSGNASHGVEVGHGARCGTTGTNPGAPTLATGFQSVCNGGCGVSAQSGYAFVTCATLVANGSLDLFGWNMGTVAQQFSSIGTVSPAPNTEGNLNSICVYYSA